MKRAAFSLTLVVGGLLGAVACFLLLTNRPQENAPDPKQEPLASRPIQLPNAAEVFRLRNECAKLGEKILADNVVGSALTQEQISHYEPRSGHCYVELDVHTADVTKFGDYNKRYLFDGQTKELLAFVGQEKGKERGMVYDSQHQPASSDFSTDAGDYINQMMADKDR